MKNKEQVNKELGSIQVIGYEGTFDESADYVTIADFISSIRQNDVDELIEFVEGKKKYGSDNHHMVYSAEDCDNTANSVLSDIITHLKSIKEKI